MPRPGYTYILASKKRGTLYICVTSELVARVWRHKEGYSDGFARKYGVHRLVYYEHYDDIYDAIVREKQLKKWNMAWKIRLVEKDNPNWYDLYYQLAGP